MRDTNFTHHITNSLLQASNFLNGIRKWKLAFLLGFVGVLFMLPTAYGDSPAPSTFGSSATISVTNNSTTTDFEGPLPIDMNPANLISGAFVNSTAGDILFTDQNSVEVGGVGTNIGSNAVPFFWYTEVDKGTSKQLKLYTFNATPATHKFPLGGTLTDDITVADSASLNILDHLTLEASIQLEEDPTGTQEIFYKQGEYRVYLDSGVLKATIESQSISESWGTQNIVPDVSPTYNHSSPVNNAQDGVIYTNSMGYCKASGNDSAGWGTNNLTWEQNTGSGYSYDFTEQWIWPLNKELWALDGKVGIPTLPRKGPWAMVINGIDVAGVYNHGSPTVQQQNQGSGAPYYGEDLIELVNDPEGHSTPDNFVNLALISWGANGVPDVDWDTTGNWPWGGQWVHGDELLHNLWNDSDQQSADWYNTYMPTYYSSGVKANGNVQYTGGGSYANALLLSTLWAGWDMPVDANNPNFNSNDLHRTSDYLSFDTTTGYPPSGVSNGIQPWWDDDRAVLDHHGGNSGVWWGCTFTTRFTDFDDDGLDNIVILGMKAHAIASFNGTTGQDYMNLQYFSDPESASTNFNNAGAGSGGKYRSWAGQAMSQSFDHDYYHYGEPSQGTAYPSFTHPTTDNTHPSYGQTITVPSNYGFRDCYGHIGSYCGYWMTQSDIDHVGMNVYFGSGSNSKIDLTALWVEVRYFADEVTSETANVVSSATLQKDVTYDVKLTFDKPDVKLWVDDVEVGSATLDGEILDTGSNIVIGESIAGWVDDIKIGSTDISSPTYVLNLGFEPSHNTNTQIGDVSNSWTYLGTIADQSGSANNAIYSLVADTTDIVSTVGGLQVTDDIPAGTGTETVANMVGAVPIATFLTPGTTDLQNRISSGAVSEDCPIDPATGLQVDPACIQGEHSPFIAGFFEADENSGMPKGVWWLLMGTLLATVAGSKLFKFIPSLTIVAIIGGVVLGMITIVAGLSYWFLLFYALWAMGSISIHQYWKA